MATQRGLETGEGVDGRAWEGMMAGRKPINGAWEVNKWERK